jgi:tetratricopeptide (TPR) repeat protein
MKTFQPGELDAEEGRGGMGGVSDADAEPPSVLLGGQGVQLGDGSTHINKFSGISAEVTAGRDAYNAGRDITLIVQPPPASRAQQSLVVGNVPQAPPAFQPREDLLAQVRSAGTGVSVVRAVTGMRGVGKTQVAAAYARECIDAGWRLVAWVNGETMPEVLSGLAEVATQLGVETVGASVEQVGQRVRNRLEADGERRLLVFDSVTDASALRPYIPSGKCEVVVTGTSEGAASLGRPVTVEVFTEDEALAFLAERTRHADPAGARELARELGHLPLALAQAAALIAAQRLTYPLYLDRLRSFPLADYLRPTDGEPYPRGLAEAILLSVEAVRAADQTGLCGPLLDVIAMLSPAGVSRGLLARAGVDGFFSQSRKRSLLARKSIRHASSADVDAALGRLSGASLLSFTADGATVTAHRMVMRVARERLVRDGHLAVPAKRMFHLLNAVYPSLLEPWKDRLAARDFVQQVSALTEHLTGTLADGHSEVNKDLLILRHQALWVLGELGDSALQAMDLGESLVADRARLLGDDHPDTLSSRGDLAYAYQEAGRLPEAITLYEAALAGLERQLGDKHPDTLRSRNNLANAYQDADRLPEAITLYEAALAGLERRLGDEHPDILSLQSNLANVYGDAGWLAEAITLHEQTLATRARVLGDEHPDTLSSRNNLADTYMAADRLPEAITLHEQTLATRIRVLGDEHPHTLASRNNLGSAYRAAGRLPAAITLYEAALAGRERVLGADHPHTVRVRNTLADARREAEG